MRKKIITGLLFFFSYFGLFCFGFFSLYFLYEYLHDSPGSDSLFRWFLLVGENTQSQLYFLIPIAYSVYAAWATTIIARKRGQPIVLTMSKFLPAFWSVISLGITVLLLILWLSNYQNHHEEAESRSFLTLALIFCGLSFVTSVLYIFSNRKLLLAFFPISAFCGSIVTIIKTIPLYNEFKEALLPFTSGNFLLTIFGFVIVWLIITLVIFLQHRQLSLERMIITRILMFWTGIWLFALQILSLLLLMLPLHLGYELGYGPGEPKYQPELYVFVAIVIVLHAALIIWGLRGKKAKDEITP